MEIGDIIINYKKGSQIMIIIRKTGDYYLASTISRAVESKIHVFHCNDIDYVIWSVKI